MNAERRAEVAKGVRRLVQDRRLLLPAVAAEADVPPHILKRLLDGDFTVPSLHFARLNDWYLRELAKGEAPPRRRPGVPADYALRPAEEPPPVAKRYMNLAEASRQIDAQRRRLESLEVKVDELMARQRAQKIDNRPEGGAA